MTIDPGEFRRVLGHFPTGVTVVTGVGDEGPAGMAIGSFASVSLDPPLVMFCPGKDSGTWHAIRETGSFCATHAAAASPASARSPTVAPIVSGSTGPPTSPGRRSCRAAWATSTVRSMPSSTAATTTS